ncbi:MAG: peptidoglycan-binding protein [Clostridia bacterium]|nr:peptidoglycan-binding protein [Clostridia bacterium]
MMTSENTRGVAVENLQRYLRQLSLYDRTIPPVAIDGIYDVETRDAILAFQKMSGLDQTGVVDYTTWTQLFDAYMASVLRYDKPQAFSPFPRFPIGYSVGSGNRQFLVEIIQYILNELSVWMDGIPRNAQGGIYDEDTENGIILFQRASLLPETGRVDRTTWNALILAYNRMQEESM